MCLDRFCPRLKLFAGFQISWKSVDELKLQLQADRKKYTVQRDTGGGDKCKVKDVLFLPQPRISFHGILNKTAWFPGVGGGRSHICNSGMCTASRLCDSGKGHKNHPSFTGRLRDTFYFSLSFRSGSLFFLTIPDFSWSTWKCAKITLPLSSKWVNYCLGQGLKLTFFVQNLKDTAGTLQ